MKHLFTLFLSLVLLTSLGYAQKTDILSEGFEDGTLPAGWSNVYGAGDNDNWAYQTGGANGGAYPETAHSGTMNAIFRGFPNPSVTKLVTPALDLSSGGTLNFWYASHTYFGAGDIDLLTVYYKEGFTGSWIQLETYPDGADDWTEATFNLPASSEIYLAFEGSYDGGMGVCIDDVHVFTSDTDLGINEIQPILAYGTETTPKVKVQNYGLVEASSYDVNLIIDGTDYNQTITTGANIPVGGEMTIEFPVWTLPAEGTYEMTATVTIAGDASTENNTMTTNCVVDQSPIGNLLGYFDSSFGGQTYHCAYPETDGNHIYVGKWATSEFAKYTMTGTPVGDAFTIDDFFGDDLAYDGQYFYTGNWDGTESVSNISQLDLANETLVNTFTTEVTVSSLAHNNNTSTFWGNNYGNVYQEFDGEGEYTGNQFVGPDYISSTAIDIYSDPENPKMWFFEMGAAAVAVQLIEYDLNTQTATGRTIPIDAEAYPGVVYGNGNDKDLAGGLACYVNNQNQVVLLVGIQQIYENYDGRILFVYLGEAAVTNSITITIIDEEEAPIQGATVLVGTTKYSDITDENGEATFNLVDGSYEYAVTKDCYTSNYGDFTITDGTPSINTITLNSVAAPTFSNATVLANGLTIEATFDSEMDLNGQSAPADFEINVEENNLNITNIELKAGNNNIIVLTVENIIYTDQNVTLSYTDGNIQSTCEIALENITDQSVTNNSDVSLSVNNINSEVSIFPNPSNGIFTINFDLLSSDKGGQSNVKITDITGKSIEQLLISNSQSTIDLSKEPKGIYFITIKTINNIFTEKIIIQ